MVEQVVKYLNMTTDKVYVDCTLGEGGHTHFFLENFNLALMIGIELDPQLFEVAKERLKNYKNFVALNGNFKNLDLLLENLGIKEVDGIFFDLGVSMFHFKAANRGFSFQGDEELDMRISGNGKKASEILNTLPEEEISNILWQYGEEKFARKIAKAIVNYRVKSRIERNSHLIEIIKSVIPSKYWYKRIHPATRTFQALRIYVNDELNNLSEGIDKSIRYLKREGRLCVISYHSLEDRIVKHKFRFYEKEGIIKILTKKPVVPDKEEIIQNKSARSAKLRACEKIV